MGVSELARLRQLEEENSRLKKLVAERHIESALDEMLFSGGSLNAKLLGFQSKVPES